MSLVIGRLSFDAPDQFTERVGEAPGRVGGVPVPGGRSGLSSTATLTSWADTAAQRERLRRQLRSLMNNLPMRLAGLYVAWADDGEHNGWFVPGSTTFDLDGVSLDAAVWNFGAIDLALVGRPRTHRRGVVTYLRDRQLSTTARDTLARIYSTDFSGLTKLALTWLPSTVTDPTVQGFTPLTLTGARAGYGSSSLRAVIGGADLSVLSFEQAEASRNLGDVVVYDRAGTTTAPTGGPDAAWEEVYGPDFPLTTTDVPLLDNSLCRVRYLATNTPGFAIDRWTGSAWSEQGKMLIYREGDTSGYCDTLVSQGIVEWTPDRAIVRAVMRRAADAYSREEVIITLQRGWTGPRFEMYPAPKANGSKAGSYMAVSSGAAAVNDSAAKVDAAGAGVIAATAGSGSTALPSAVVGAATFTGENWISLVRSGQAFQIVLAALQAGAAGWSESAASAYGSARNGIGLEHTSAGYLSAHVGLPAMVADQQGEAESWTLSSGTSSAADATASAGNSAQASSTTADRAHVTRATWPNGQLAKYRVFARVRTTSGTLSVRAVTGATTGATKTTTSTTYVWLDLGDIVADGGTLTIRAWCSSAVTYHVDRIEAHKVEDRTATTTAYDGARDLGQEVLYDSRSPQTIVTR